MDLGLFVPFKEPPETDLEYYARPENYTGSNLRALTRFIMARRKENAKLMAPPKEQMSLKEQCILTEPNLHFVQKDSFKKDLASSRLSSVSDDEKESMDQQGQSQKQTQMLNSMPKEKNKDKMQSKVMREAGNGVPVSESKSAKNSRNSKAMWVNHVGRKIFLDHQDIKGGTPEVAVDVDGPIKQILLTEVKIGKPRAKSAPFTFRRLEFRTAVKCRSARSKLNSMSKVVRRKQIVDKFRKTISAVKVVLKLAKSIMKTSDSPSALLKTFMQLSKDPDSEEGEDASSENMKKYGLHFDPSYYKANREISLSSEVRSILKLHPNRRTPEQIQTTVFGLQSIPSFAEYPLHMQEKLAKVAWLDIVTPNRTIIRQGHFAENFYFIVSGQALVTIHRPGDSSAQTAALMRKGTSFGELALLHHSRRTATVTSHDTVQLLSVGRDDFFDIFMSRHVKGEVPEHIKYLSQLEFMKDWPMERLIERPDQCLLHFFKRNMVIVKDSHSSEWLYVVKSGSCHVLKQLKGVTARIGQLRGGRAESKSNKVLLHGGNVLEEKKSSRLSHRLGSIDANNSDLENAKLNTLGVDGAPQLKSLHGSAMSSSKTGDDPVFVRIQLLKPMDVFGLDLVNFNNSVEVESTSVNLVSLGSECIMLSKSFFMKYANDKVKKRLSETVTPYPNEATLQDSLQHKVNWELYKQSILREASAKCKLLKRKHLTVYR